MLRYVLAAWNSQDRAQGVAATELRLSLTVSSQQWQVAFEDAGILALASKTRYESAGVIRLGKRSGVVLGTLFEASHSEAPSKRVVSVGEDEAQRILQSGGHRLIAEYWGSYVAVVFDATAGKQWVIRDPSASLDCLRLDWNGLHLFVSSLECVSQFRDLPLEPNMRYFATSLSRDLLDTRETCVRGVRRLVGGECQQITRDSETELLYWRPQEIVQNDPIRDPLAATKSVRDTTRSCIATWNSCHNRIALSLSGGLDSAVVLSCLKEVSRSAPTICINAYYTRAANSDEREYARRAAENFPAGLIEYEPSPEFDARAALRPALAADWFDWLGQLAWAGPLHSIAREARVDAIYSGSGGDEVFFREGPQYAYGDILRTQGMSRSAIVAALWQARLDSASVWRVLFRGMRDGLIRNPADVLFGRSLTPSRLLTAEALQLVADRCEFQHPWLQSRARIPLGKMRQVTTLAFTRHANNAFSDDLAPQLVSPLFSQPLIELGLRIETATLAEDGWDRVVARRAFEGHVSRDVLWRRSKSFLSEFFNHLVEHNRQLIRETILDGSLVRDHLVNPTVFDETLSNPLDKVRGHGMDICTLFGAETWYSSLRARCRSPARARLTA